MSKQNQSDMSLSAAVFMMVIIGLTIWGVSKFAYIILMPWKGLRLVELALSFQWGTMMKLWNATMTDYDQKFTYVNERVWMVYQWIAIPMLYYGVKAAKSVNFLWTMEDHLQVLYQRFKWLHLVMDLPKGFYLKKKFPYLAFAIAPVYTDVHFPEGTEPLDYFAEFREVLPEKLKSQLGPMIKTKDRKIVWADKYAKELAMECYKRIPDKRPMPDAKSWREQAWQDCVQNHRYERTFALGMFQAARDFGVFSAMEMLHLRKNAGADLQNKDDGGFCFWRAVVSFGGRCVYSEGSGIICHYYFEKALTDYLTKSPDDREVAHYMRAQPWIKNALDSFFEVDDVVLNAPDVVALKKAGGLKR